MKPGRAGMGTPRRGVMGSWDGDHNLPLFHAKMMIYMIYMI